MARLVSRIAAAAAISSLAAACAVTDHFDGRVGTFGIAAEQARDEMIFTNIIRASKSEPLAFLQLGQVSGSNTATAQMGLPSLVLGPVPPYNATTGAGVAHYLDGQSVFGANPGASGFTANSMSTSGTTNFNITPAETKDFYTGLLTTVEPETLAFFIEQGIAPELLFYLFTDKVVEKKAGVINQYSNDPLGPSFAGFQHYVALAMAYGLTAEPEPGSKPPKPANSNKSDKTNGANADNQPARVWRLCFDRSAWAPGTKFADNHPICGSKEKTKDPREVTFRDGMGKLVEARVFPRSTFSIYQYLGRLVAAGDAGAIKLMTPQAKGAPPLEDDTLFTITSGAPPANGGDCFLTNSYGGHNYCLPDSALNSKRILGLLAQLMALSTSIQDVGITQQVQLLPQ